MWDEYVWLVVVGAFVMFFMAWGIGANDVANAFATSVGSKTLTLWQATVLAAIFEFAGAIGLGRNVSTTIGKRLAEPDEFTAIPEVLMWAMFSALLAASIWLLVATMLELPVSTTHSIVGGVIGAALVARGGSAINWGEIDEEEIFPLTGVAAVVISWVFSPVCSGIIAAFFFLVVRFTVLRSSNSFSRAWWALPILVGLCFFINAFYICDKGGVAKEFEFETSKSAWIAAIVAAIATVISIPIMLLLRNKYLKDEEKALEMAKKLEQDPEKVVGSDKDDSSGDESSMNTSFFKKLSHAVNNNPLSNAINKNDPHHATAEEKTAAIHANAEKFDDRTEGVFRYLQVLTSCADSFAHGANDVGNAVGPFAAIYAIYRQGLFSDDDIGLPEWILVIGGFGIVLGLATYGYHIIRAIGVKFVKVTPSRGFVIELGSALVVVTGSYLGLPLSTTHCQVGAELFVGLCDGHRGVSWPILIRTALGWVVTLIFAGLISALIMALGIFTPNLRATEALDTIKLQLNETSTTIHDAVTAKCSPAQLGDSIDPVTAYAWGASETFQYPLRIADGIEYVGELAANNMDECSDATIVRAPAAELFPTVQEQIDDDIADYEAEQEDS